MPALPRITGGLIAVYELANALVAIEDHVEIVHIPSEEGTLRTTAQIPWFSFDAAVEHRFLSSLDPDQLPVADILVYTVMSIDIGRSAWSGDGGSRMVERLQASNSPAGLPLLFVQGLGVFPPDTELVALRGPGPKACVASWMVDNLVLGGLPPREVVHVANGLDHGSFRLVRSIDDRAPTVAMNFTPHPMKNMGAALEALSTLHRDLAVPATLFGNKPPSGPLGPGIEHVNPPSKAGMADLYNRSSLYLQPSTTEGFGLCAVEAMACGCALVTTANGGAADYAIDGETAVVCGSEPEAMVDALGGLVRDDARRIRIATEGARHAQRFRWSISAEVLRGLALDYLAAPGEFGAGRGTALDASDLVR